MLVWGFHLGVAGIALGTAFGAWVNVGMLVWLGRRRDLLADRVDISPRALPAILLAAVATGGGAWLACGWRELSARRRLRARHACSALAIVLGGLGYGAVIVCLPPHAAARPLRRKA